MKQAWPGGASGRKKGLGEGKAVEELETVLCPIREEVPTCLWGWKL